MHKRFSAVLTAVIVLICCSGVVWGQVTTARISGKVQDETGGVLPGVTVSVKSSETGLTRTAVTDPEGNYLVLNLQPGTYEVSAELEGFQTVVRTGITLAVGGEAAVQLVMQVGTISDRVVVTGEAPLLSTNPATAGVINESQMRDLPLNARDFVQLATLQAGAGAVVNIEKGNSKGYGTKIAFAGARPYQTQILLDGGDVNGMQNFRTSASSSGSQLGVESVREFQVLVGNYGADVSGLGGGVINALTRSGTNEFHGSAYEFMRNDALDTRNFFDPDAPPDFSRNQFGVSLGGPIARNRSFFFVNYEGLRQTLGVSHAGGVPTAATRQGRLPGQTVQVNPEIVPFMNLWPLPNGREFSDGTAEYLWTSADPTREDYMVAKVDYNLTDSDALTARYTFSDSDATDSLDLPLFNATRPTRYQYADLEYRKIFSPTWFNTARFHLNRNEFKLGFSQLVDIPDSLLQFPGRPFASFGVPGLSDIGPDTGAPRIENMTLFEFANDLSHTMGKHDLKFGILAKLYQLFRDAPFRNGGSYTFDSLAAFVQGRPQRVQFGGFGGTDSVRNLRQSLFGLYAQDNVRVSDRLTLNLGVRWEFTTVPTEIDGKLSNLIDPSKDPQPVVGDPWYQNSSLRNIAPRFGMAWNPFGTARTSVRSGVGLYYDAYMLNYLGTATVRMPPFFQSGELNRPPHIMIAESLAVVPASQVQDNPQSVTYYPDSPYTLQYNVTVQQLVRQDLALTLAYVGSKGANLPYVEETNTALPSAIIDGRKFFAANLPRRNPAYGGTHTTLTKASSYYHSLQVRLEKRFKERLRFDGSYTFAKSIDDSSAAAGITDFDFSGRGQAQDPENLRASRGLSAFDVRHSVVLTGTYLLPGVADQHRLASAMLNGWQISSIMMLASGSPFTISIAGDYARNRPRATGQTRPDLREGADNNPVLGGPDRYYDVNAFVLQPRGFFGNLGRNTVIGPGLISWDVTAEKSFTIRGSARMILRVDGFNLLNRANFAQPVAQAFSASGPVGSAGRITRTVTSSRQIQLALKFVF